MEQFLTLQGEGFHQGRSAYFIRIAGCDVGCVWCDVKESWPADAHPVVSIASISEQAAASKAKIAVITGGEPMMYDMAPLCDLLHQNNLFVHVETSGAHPLTGNWDWICLSPKKFKAPREEYLLRADELKVIVFNKHDLEWAEEYAAKVNPECLLYLQVEWEKREEMTPIALNYIRNNPKWRLSVQTHKYIGIP